jgi:hypothetical protein
MSVPWGGGGDYTPLSGQKWMPSLPGFIFKVREAGVWVSRSATPKVYIAGAWEVKIPQYWNGAGWAPL